MTDEQVKQILDEVKGDIDKETKRYAKEFSQPMVGMFLVEKLQDAVNELGEFLNPRPKDMIIALAIVTHRLDAMCKAVAKKKGEH